jgi:hypothetical protein
MRRQRGRNGQPVARRKLAVDARWVRDEALSRTAGRDVCLGYMTGNGWLGSTQRRRQGRSPVRHVSAGCGRRTTAGWHVKAGNPSQRRHGRAQHHDGSFAHRCSLSPPASTRRGPIMSAGPATAYQAHLSPPGRRHLRSGFTSLRATQSSTTPARRT